MYTVLLNLCKIKMHRYLLTISLSAVPSLVIAAPDAGSMLQQIERDKQLQQMLPHKNPAELATPPPEMKPSGGISVSVREFRFTGNTLLSADKLSPAIADFLNRPLDFNGLNLAAAAVAEVYRQQGWIVRSYLPAQDIQDGIVTIHIVEAIFGGAQLEGGIPPRASSEKILKIIDKQQKIGEPLSAIALDRALLLADDLPGATVAGSLKEGAKERESALDVKLGDKPLATGEAALDNTGARSTGRERLSANISLGSPFKLGDTVSANLLHTQGSDYLLLGGNIPLGSDGWRTGLSASHLGYKLVAPEFAALNANGTSDTLGFEATYPLIRSRLKNLYLNLNTDFKRFNNLASGKTSSNYKVDTLSLGTSGNFYDNLAGGGSNSAGITLVYGMLNLDGSPTRAGDASTTQTAGHYAKLRYSLSRQQVLTDSVSLSGAFSGQIASKNLDSSEKFYLGGSTGVRAYPSSEGGGAEGQSLSLELRYRLPEGLNLTGFYDYGHITINKENNFASAAALNDYSLMGAGLALGWQSSMGFSLKGIYARRIGSNPNPTASGNDQDGLKLLNRFWLTATFPFSYQGSSMQVAPALPVVSQSTENVVPAPLTVAIPQPDPLPETILTPPVASPVAKKLQNSPSQASVTAIEEALIRQTVMQWAEAWSRRDVAAYLSFYAADFGNGMRRKEWEAQRKSRLRKYPAISVTVKQLEISYTGGEAASAYFSQDFLTDTYKEKGTLKELRLKKLGARWIIVGEKTQ